MEIANYPTPTESGLKRRLGEFTSLAEALDYAAQGQSGINFYSAKGVLLESLPYSLLKEQAKETAGKLLTLGLKKGDRVAVIAESDSDFSRIFFACQYAGLIPAPMPLPVAFAGKSAYINTLRGMIHNATAKAVITAQTIQSWTPEIIDGFSLCFGGTPEELMAIKADKDIELPIIDSDDISYLQFSSGSTRFPMGVAVTQKACLANVYAIAKYGLVVRETGDRCVSWLPLYHDMGLVGFFITPVTCQLSIDLLPTRDFARRPLVWLDIISRNKGTLSYSPSFGFELCARRAPTSTMELDLSSWRAAGIGGDMIRSHILEQFAIQYAQYGFSPKAFVASYGMAEATLALTFAPLDTGVKTDTVDLHILETDGIAKPCNDPHQSVRTFVLCGPILPGHEMEVRDEQGNILPERHVGSVFVRGPSLMKGYFHQEEETKRILSADGWLRTGDLGYMLNNEIVITGREKDLIIINGRNIWPQDLEWSAEHHFTALRSRDVAVFSVDTDEHESIVALVQCRFLDPQDRQTLQEEMVNLFRRQHGVEVSVILVPPHSLPQTSSGKLTRARARKMLLDGEFNISA
ncbi:MULTISPECIES: fatty acyl-AMP ligase [Commensalibacter]|uniref:O-succinylbenzoic acid-CoA ligase MenE or related acyl-CoA synthetase (AMP-forming) (MenE/FadK) (PDB:5EY9) (PUBMED:25151136) n=1 Tax=Commensalibacter papalotli (ex Botero et al. 2024) TaxID=2972766 RepID=A0ABM9HQC3_9PROT|nr:MULTISPECIES: fatty acyl-AMP ligase [Commensalibacter]CAI3945322.1 O-succinylbenzoic acid-CoA ligase MenE or related acyl-CoA synthetase (AMP-forming) (MenE/FadK) (PDB:5EY9) (PUBMED:25151136 [Commensalibacter papalotli (ex Botero et al. 2024)]CAI3945532.1 O-succinylbenzoic acid-CoA ligase MenE or related acyl-CoA synthetase (AMP-forming) (MenE/FadK) (PDB:5EY9) (PUBMED:25151136 [Commensalibacter papalotli (ex Botero et al. 2024)]